MFTTLLPAERIRKSPLAVSYTHLSTFGVSIVLMVIDQMAFMLQNDMLETIVGWTSFSSRFVPFAKGILDVSSIVFFLSVAVGFLFLTARKLESRRWN